MTSDKLEQSNKVIREITDSKHMRATVMWSTVLSVTDGIFNVEHFLSAIIRADNEFDTKMSQDK